MQFITDTCERTIELGKVLGKSLKKGDVVAFTGTLAAGKTYFTKGIALALQIEEEITSPTFTIVSEYSGALPLYHFDLYRLTSYDDFSDMGGEEYLYGDGVCVIEWSEKILNELPKNTIFVDIQIKDETTREITINNCPYAISSTKSIFGEN
ncbi:MAG: tRNA (adenosine(37)-N6)-threonylcarbamoyltransferase complex ATPase subunit type 1 TsaE [Treponema sp.]